jgi:hypothetical protein
MVRVPFKDSLLCSSLAAVLVEHLVRASISGDIREMPSLLIGIPW